MRVSYKCPICNKSLANMETQFRNLDIVIQSQPMPPEFRDTKAVILCNDCSGRCTVPYHWVGLKCAICLSYNTVELQIIGGQSDVPNPAASERQAPVVTEESSAPWPTGLPPRARNGSGLLGRRRHSSNIVESAHTVPDRIARSLSPTVAVDSIMYDDSDNDIIWGFWNTNDDDDSSDLDEADSDEDSDKDEEEEEEEEEEDDENEIMLFGHR